MLLSLFLGALVGALLGATGAGGGMLAVPALMLGLGWTLPQAAPVALLAVATGASLGALDGLRHGLVRYKAALLMVAVGVPLTALGQVLAHTLPALWLAAAFAAVMLSVAQRLLRQPRRSDDTHLPSARLMAHLDPSTGRFHWSVRSAAIFAAIGALTGTLAGLLGVGGGFVIVPALRRFSDLSLHAIVATSLFVVALVGIGGAGAALLAGASLPMPHSALFILATAVGMLFARRFATRLPEALLARSFAFLLVGAAALLLGNALRLH